MKGGGTGQRTALHCGEIQGAGTGVGLLVPCLLSVVLPVAPIHLLVVKRLKIKRNKKSDWLEVTWHRTILALNFLLRFFFGHKEGKVICSLIGVIKQKKPKTKSKTRTRRG
jgi:hypothetical protein